MKRTISKLFCRQQNPASRKKRYSLDFEALETKTLLATIIWDNPSAATNGFNTYFGSNAGTATDIVNHAIADWERYIDNFNYQNAGAPGQAPVANTYNVDISATLLGPNILGVTSDIFIDAQDKPYQSSIELDNNGAGAGWYFDTSVAVDSEFPVIVNAFAAGMTTSNLNANKFDLYTIVVHELGHSMGVFGHVNVPGGEDLMSPSATPGQRRLISDITLDEVVTTGNDGYAHDYTLSFYADYPDNMYVKVIGGDLYVRGTNGNDAITIWQAQNNEMVVNVNGYIERTSVSDFDDFDIKTFAGNDTATVTLSVAPFFDGGTVDLGSGTDKFVYRAPNDSSNYGISANGDQVSRPYLFIGPSPYRPFTHTDVETVTLRGGSGADTITIGIVDAAVVQAFGEGGNDSIKATSSTNTVQMWGDAGNDTLWSGSGNDYVKGGAGNDSMRGGSGNDNMQGDDGNDNMLGQAGNDYMLGGNGNDIMAGNAGTGDSLYGNAGADTFNVWGPDTTDDYFKAVVQPDGRIRVDRRVGSHTGTVVDREYLDVDLSDFVWIRSQDGDDDIIVDAAVGSLVNGTVDGGAGTDTAVVPGNWSKINVEN